MISTRLWLVGGALGIALLAGCPGEPTASVDAGPRSDSGGPGTDTGPAADAGPGTDAPSTTDSGPLVGAAPVASIFHPSDGEDRRVSIVVPMIGDANDAEDGALPGAVMLWTSDVEGAIGTGRMFDWTPTMTGAQVVTLTVTDSDGQSDSDSISLDIIP